MLVEDGADELILVDRECDGPNEVAVVLWPVLVSGDTDEVRVLVWPVLVGGDTEEVTITVWVVLLV